MSQVLQRISGKGYASEVVLLQAAMDCLARGGSVALSPDLGILVTQAVRRCGTFAPTPPRPVRLGLRRPAIG